MPQKLEWPRNCCFHLLLTMKRYNLITILATRIQKNESIFLPKPLSTHCSFAQYTKGPLNHRLSFQFLQCSNFRLHTHYGCINHCNRHHERANVHGRRTLGQNNYNHQKSLYKGSIMIHSSLFLLMQNGIVVLLLYADKLQKRLPVMIQ